MKKHYISFDYSKENPSEIEAITSVERLENGSLRFHETILINKNLRGEEREKEKQLILKSINEKYKD